MPEGFHDGVDRPGSTSRASSSPRATRRRVSCRPSPRVTNLRKICFGGTPAFLIERRVDAFGSRRQRSGDPAELLVRGEGQTVLVPTFEELSEGVLEQRERAWLMGDVGDDLRHQPGLGPDADPFDRPPDRLLELVGREGRHHLGSFSEQLPETRVDQRAVVEVRPDGHDDAEPALGVGGGHTERFEEEFPLPLVGGEREDLLELIDHEHDLGLPRRDQIDRLEQAPGPDSSRSCRRGTGRTAIRSIAASSSSIGWAPGNISAMNGSSWLPKAPRRIAGTSPARTTEDFRPRSGRRRRGTWMRARPP